MARPGEILLDDATRRAARGRLATDPRGSVVLRGQSTAVELHALRGEAGMGAWLPYRCRGPGPAGRSRRRARRRSDGALERVGRRGRGEAILIEGEAGMGKSRLLTAAEAPARDAGFLWTWTENVSYGRGEPYRWARLFAPGHRRRTRGRLRARSCAAACSPTTSHRRCVRRYGGAIAAIARDAAFSGWEAEAADMPTDPAEVASTLAEVAVAYLDRLLRRPGRASIVIDDLHWLDPSSVGHGRARGRADGRPPGPRAGGIRPGAAAGLGEPDGREPHRARRSGGAGDRAAGDARRARRGGSRRARRIHERTGGQPAVRRRDGPRVPRGRHAPVARRSRRDDRRASGHGSR